MADPTAKRDPGDRIQRGTRGPTPLGTTIFIGLRALDVPLQYQLLAAGGWGASLLHKLGLATVPVSPAAAAHTGIALVDRLGLPADRLVLLAMALGSTAKQVFWLTYISKEAFPAPLAASVAAFNTVVNSAGSLLLVAAATSASLSGWRVPAASGLPAPVVAGALLYLAGLSLETVAELQRKRFKDRPRNAGRVCRSGLWAYARHVNYAGYAVWRGGYAMAASGFVGGLAFGCLVAWDLGTRAVAALGSYGERKYGEQWRQFKRDVPYAMFPGIY